jgi:hypothetical protein
MNTPVRCNKEGERGYRAPVNKLCINQISYAFEDKAELSRSILHQSQAMHSNKPAETHNSALDELDRVDAPLDVFESGRDPTPV